MRGQKSAVVGPTVFGREARAGNRDGAGYPGGQPRPLRLVDQPTNRVWIVCHCFTTSGHQRGAAASGDRSFQMIAERLLYRDREAQTVVTAAIEDAATRAE